MGDILSQDEINALLKNDTDEGNSEDNNDTLKMHEKDALGEIGNISMGTAATTLSYLTGKKVTITTPSVAVTSWDELVKTFDSLHVGVRVEYKAGLEGSNLMVLKEYDVKLIADLMMGGDGSKTEGEVEDLHLSAISEAMNQMVGSASTSMSDMFEKKIAIYPPVSFLAKSETGENVKDYEDCSLVKISFRLIIDGMTDSKIMQIIPMRFAKEMVEQLMGGQDNQDKSEIVDNEESAKAFSEEGSDVMEKENHVYEDSNYEQDDFSTSQSPMKGPVDVQPAKFESFDNGLITVEKKNINLIMDVPLEVTVELGRTQKLIRDILELSPGSIIELDKLAGEPVDILVNGKKVAKGEVVVIDESFGVRITEIVHPSKRI